MGNADLSIKLKRRWMKAKLRSETSRGGSDRGASGTRVIQTNGQGLFEPERDSICIEHGGKYDGDCA